MDNPEPCEKRLDQHPLSTSGIHFALSCPQFTGSCWPTSRANKAPGWWISKPSHLSIPIRGLENFHWGGDLGSGFCRKILGVSHGDFPSDQSDDADFVRSRETMWAGVNKQERWTERIWNRDIHKLQPSIPISRDLAIHFVLKFFLTTQALEAAGRSTCGAGPRQFRCI